MNFIKVGELIAKQNDEFPQHTDARGFSGLDYFSDEYEAYRTAMADLEEQATLVKVTMKDGKEILQAEENFNGGVCDDCQGDSKEGPVLKYEYFKLG